MDDRPLFTRRRVLTVTGAAVGTAAVSTTGYASTDQPEQESSPIEWQQTYSESEADQASAVVQRNDGGYAFVADVYDTSTTDATDSEVWLVTTDSEGTVQWETHPGGDKWHYPTDLLQTDDGGYLIACSRKDEDDAGLVKTAPDGSLAWTFTYQGPPEENEESWDQPEDEESSTETFYSVTRGPDGGYVVAGQTGKTGERPVLVHVSETGELQEEKVFDVDGFQSVTQGADGGYVVVGSTEDDDGVAMHVDESFEVIWTTRLSEVDSLEEAITTQAGGHAVSGTFAVEGDEDGGFHLATLDANGSVQFSKVYSENDDLEEFTAGLAQTANGGFVLTGHADADRVVRFIGTGPDGMQRSAENLGDETASPPNGNPVAPTDDGGAIATYTANMGDGPDNIGLVKLGAEFTAAQPSPTPDDSATPTDTETQTATESDTPTKTDDGRADQSEPTQTAGGGTTDPTDTATSTDTSGSDEDDCKI